MDDPNSRLRASLLHPSVELPPTAEPFLTFTAFHGSVTGERPSPPAHHTPEVVSPSYALSPVRLLEPRYVTVEAALFGVLWTTACAIGPAAARTAFRPG